MSPSRYTTTLGNVVDPSGLSRKRKRALRYGYAVGYMEHDHNRPGDARRDELVEVVMGKSGIGRKRSAEKVKKINRFVEAVGGERDMRNPDVEDIQVTEGRNVCVAGILMIIAAIMVGGWGLLVWLIEGEEYKRD
ncbi:hypothetical protein TrRE_jg7119 [Triparma retinervis]|uniref:Uncharacterized protein n=1 Tax=Triparma retinervis TaxID=2557542 RepID=A0A9W7DUY0_9STRA|nr:hypothetical protein TrRE_jg7119 [Triparma retinervis]